MRRTLFITCSLLVLILTGVPLAAQSRLFDGASLGGRIAADAPTAQYLFDASAGERIRLRVLGLNGLDPMVTLLAPDGAEFLTGWDDPWSPEPGDSFLAFNAPVGGPYTVFIVGENESSGDYLLQFAQSPAGSAALLPGGQTTTVPISAATGPLRLMVATHSACPTALVIQPPAGSAGLRAAVNLYSEDGALIGQWNGGWNSERRLTLAPGSGQVQVEIIPEPGSADGALAFTTSCADAQPVCQEPLALDPAPAAPAPTPAGLLLVQPGGELGYGQALQGEIGALSPLLAYTFEGATGEEIALHVTGISLDFDPELTLLGPLLETVAVGERPPGSFKASDEVVRLRLPADGRYTALVGSAGEQAGAFLIRLLEGAAAPAVALTSDTPAVVNVATLEALDHWFLRYEFAALDACPTALTLATSDGRPLAVGVVVQPVGGEPSGQFYASAVNGASLVVPAASGRYEALIQRYGDIEELGQLTLRLSCQADSPVCQASGVALFSTPVPGPSPFPTLAEAAGVTPTVTLVGNPAGDVRAVVSVPSANVRRGDTTSHTVIRALPTGTEIAVVGVSANGSGWYKIITPQGEEGWMSPSVLTVAGDVDSLPRLEPPPPPRQIAPTNPPGAAPPPPGVVCGNGACEPGENCGACASDCGTCPTSAPGGPVCGNGVCEAGETCGACRDCGSCPPTLPPTSTFFPGTPISPPTNTSPPPTPAPFCGNGVCDPGENWTWCLDCPPATAAF